jgi:hypothetical protein
VTPVEDPPYVRSGILDFSVMEMELNSSMEGIDLFSVFGDPDLPPFGDDNLSFSVDNTTFPSTIIDGKLTFGRAPGFPGKEGHVVVVAVTAADRSGLKAVQRVDITVMKPPNRPPVYYDSCPIEIPEDDVSYIDLNEYFTDPDGDPMNFAYLGGASDNLTVEIAPNGSAIFRPVRDYFTAQEMLRFRAFDPHGTNGTGTLVVRIANVNDPPYFLRGGLVPDPFEETELDEGGQIAFRVSAADIDNMTSELRYTWSLDGVERTSMGGPTYTWRPGYGDAGEHNLSVRISDGLADIEAEWTATVLETNRPPAILDCWPMNNTEGEGGRKFTFRACATDPDGDPVTFAWRFSDGTVLRTDTGKNSSTFSKELPAGYYIVILDISDGNGGLTRQYIHLKIDPPPPEPDFLGSIWLGFAAIVPLFVLVAYILYAKRR